MQTSQQPWIWVRSVAVAFSAVGGTSIVRMPGDFSKPSVSFGLVLTAFCAFGVCFVWLLQTINPWSSASWERPSWSANPFSVMRPLEVFHLGAWCILSAAAGAFVLGMLGKPRSWAWELPFCVGVGTLVGIYLVAAVNHRGSSA